jgi:membrane protein YqaA with SNARE-associated domain
MLIVIVVIAGINMVPAFMPATWLVLVVFRTQWDVPLVPLIIAGSVASTFGRVVLAMATARVGERIIPSRIRKNLNALRELFEGNRTRTFWGVIGLTIAPVPSNELFIAAGLIRTNLVPIAAAFFLTRLLTYGIAVFTMENVSTTIEDLFLPGSGGGSTLFGLAISLLPPIVLSLIPWQKVIDWFKTLKGNRGKDGSMPSQSGTIRDSGHVEDASGAPNDQG